MHELRIITDMDECREVWERKIPPENISDLWGVRACFQRHFKRPACFLVAENGDTIKGLLPLSWIQESEGYGYFPGETWDGKTWLEQNRLPSPQDGVLEGLLNQCPGKYHLRYLLPWGPAGALPGTVDEVGYLFHPPDFDYDIENYFQAFSHKSAKALRKDLDDIERLRPRFRTNVFADFEHLVRLNLDRFGVRSYFHDPRFREGFRSLMYYLNDNDLLRLTTIIIRGEVAAVDLGCLYNGCYTLLAGGTNPAYLGVAKLINIHHMKRACLERIRVVDFLCGDFSWKKLFHLAPRSLFLLSNTTLAEQERVVRIRNRTSEEQTTSVG